MVARNHTGRALPRMGRPRIQTANVQRQARHREESHPGPGENIISLINIICWKWAPLDGLHPRKNILFTQEHVNRLYAMLSRNIKDPFILHCLTDNAEGIRPEVNCIPLWDDYRMMGGCYIRLRSFSREMYDLIGSDFFSIDLDVIILRDITRLLQSCRQQFEFKIWGDTNPTTPYNGSFYYMKAGARRQVWENFDPAVSPIKAKKLNYVGSDQAWIGACLGRNEAVWNINDGIYSYRVHFKEGLKKHLTGRERIIFFHGSNDPSKPKTQAAAPWILSYWQ